MWRVFFYDYSEMIVQAPTRRDAIATARFMRGNWIESIISATRVSGDT